MTLSIHSPDELIATVPHLLGFKAEESIVFVPLRPDLPLARVDLPTTASQRNEVWGAIRGAFSRYAQPGASVAIVCMTHDQQAAELIGHDLAGRAQPVNSRDTIAASLVGDREPVAQLLPEAREEIAQSTPRRDGPWALGRLQQFHADGVRLTDRDAARLLLAVESIPIRDALWNDISRDNSVSHVALWTDLTSKAPDEGRAAPASLLSFAAWQNGNGALAWCALDQVP